MAQHHHPAAQGQHVLHVVGGQEDGGAVFRIFLPEEGAQGQLAHRVQADGGLVQEEQPRLVEQASAELGAHPLAQGQLAQGRVQEVTQVEGRDQLIQPALPPGVVDVVDVPQQQEGIANRHVPPQLRTLAEHRAQVPHVLAAVLPGGTAVHRAGAGGGGQDARQQLHGRAFARAVGADQADQLALLNGEVCPGEGGDLLLLPLPQAGNAAGFGRGQPGVGF